MARSPEAALRHYRGTHPRRPLRQRGGSAFRGWTGWCRCSDKLSWHPRIVTLPPGKGEIDECETQGPPGRGICAFAVGERVRGPDQRAEHVSSGYRRQGLRGEPEFHRGGERP